VHLYIHVPFCARRCSYCDFAIAVRRAVPVGEFVDGVSRELANRDLGGETLDTVYLGGGTPSKLGGEGIAELLGRVRDRFAIAPNAEVTVEANPEDVNAAAVAAWRSAGVTRLSIGAQSFDARVLDWMHRTHSVDDTARAVEVARDAGIDNISLDLIFAVPESLARVWARDLDAALALAPSHVSVYGLTVEPRTPLGRWTARGDTRELPEDDWAAEFQLTHNRLVAAGYTHYEVSSYARAGFRSRHNEAYWLDRPYHGVGPSAHGFDGASRRWNEREFVAWLSRVRAGGDPLAGREQLGDEERVAERVYVGLRTDRGLRLQPGDDPLVQRWVEAGWGTVLNRHETRTLQLTVAGWMRLDALAAALTSLRSRY
jgi:oxygen-independent coproporphyrinogen-3 oxidase